MQKGSAIHLKRWLTGIIAVPLLIYLIGPGPRWLFYILVYGVSVVGLAEFYGMTADPLPRTVRGSAYLLTFMLFAFIYTRQVLLAPVIFVLWAMAPMALFLFKHSDAADRWTAQMGISALGPLYISLPLSMLLHLDRFIPDGNLWIFFLLTVIFANDTGAYYSGKLFGRHKLYEAVSPHKTWEGAVGGLFLSVIAGAWFLAFIRLRPLSPEIFIVIVCLAVLGQIGDLVESMIKRNQGVKDSGGILPGHGGILDRIDALLFAIPALYLYLSLTMV